jgi:hypothetical protein
MSKPSVIRACPKLPHAGQGTAPGCCVASACGCHLPIRRLLLPVWAVTAVLDLTEDGVLALIEDGALAWAFDLRRPGSGSAYWRIFAPSVADHLARRSGASPAALREFDQVVHQILPGSSDTVRSSRLRDALNVCSCHVGNLLRDGALKEVGQRTGATNAFRVERASVHRFLKERAAR